MIIRLYYFFWYISEWNVKGNDIMQYDLIADNDDEVIADKNAWWSNTLLMTNGERDEGFGIMKKMRILLGMRKVNF